MGNKHAIVGVVIGNIHAIGGVVIRDNLQLVESMYVLGGQLVVPILSFGTLYSLSQRAYNSLYLFTVLELLLVIVTGCLI